MAKIKCQIGLALVIGTYLILVLFDIPKALAAFPTPAPSPSQDPAVTEFQQKVETIKQEAATKAAQLKSEVSQNLRNKAFIGTASAVQNNQLTIQTAKAVRNILVDQYTTYQDNISKKAISFKDLKNGDFLVCLGDVDDHGNLKAKEILRQKAPTPENKVVIWGQLQSVLINTLSLLKNDGQKATISVGGDTVFNFGSKEIALSDLKVGNFVIALGTVDKNGLTAQFIDLLNKGDIKVSPASASPSARPSPAKKP